MIPKECKRLAEVDFPIAAVSTYAVMEKNAGRHNHPSILHLWWARRPLASCRSIVMGSLLPDPCDKGCPKSFKEKARTILTRIRGAVGDKDEDLQRAILKFIGDFASWDMSSNQACLEVGRRLVKAAYGDDVPLVADPFAGGGAIPLEALRLGCDVFASDLNPVAGLILKTVLEDMPRCGPKLADDLRNLGEEVKKAAAKELAAFYPDDSDENKPIAYLWARTVVCEAPGCGAEIPLARSFWLSKKDDRRLALRPHVKKPSRGVPHVVFEIYEPKSEKDVLAGSVSRAKATCYCNNSHVLSPQRVRAQLRAQHGGADVAFDKSGMRIGGARLLAVVTLRTDTGGRHYRLPTERDYRAVWEAQKALRKIALKRDAAGLCSVPDEPLPPPGTLGFRVQPYGMINWGNLFNARQKLALVTLTQHISSFAGKTAQAQAELLALSLGKTADLGNAGAPWKPGAECPVHLFSAQKIPPLWDWAEAVLTTESSGSFFSAFERSASTLESALSFPYSSGSAALADAADTGLPTESVSLWFTDPPYYDAIPYSDLSDFFFVWLKRALPGHKLLRDPFDPKNPLTPKLQEAVQDETKTVNGKPKDRAFFEETMAKAFKEGRRVLKDDGIGCVVFAHKTTEGWEALLSGMIRGGWTITASWPIATEMASRLRARDSAALATSVHLICRPRPDDAPVGDWTDVLRELPGRVRDWMERLQKEGVRGADLVFACIGPALEIFSRYSKVETAEGKEVPLAQYLEKVWEVVGKAALEQVLGSAAGKAKDGSAGAVEEDARLTALFLWTLQCTAGAGNGGNGNKDEAEAEEDADDDEEPGGKKAKKGGLTLIYDVVRRFSQPLGIHLPEWEGRIIETKKGQVRLLPIAERAHQIFGKGGADAVSEKVISKAAASNQLSLFPDEPESEPQGRKRRGQVALADEPETRHGATTLDKVHAAMLLQASGKANALRAIIKAEQDCGGEFLRLANALSALYPKGCEEKRLLDAMLLAVPR